MIEYKIKNTSDKFDMENCWESGRRNWKQIQKQVDNSEILSMDNFLQIVKEHLPQAGTELSIYTFLASDDLWLGKLKSQRSFVAVAEDTILGLYIVVMDDGSVHLLELPDERKHYDLSNLDEDHIIGYCSTNFPAFMEIMNLYMEAERRLADLEPAVETDVFEKECEKAEAELRRKVDKIDSTAIEDPDGLWSTMIEEMGAGIC